MRRVCIALMLLAAVGCSGSSKTPASPTPTTATPTAFADFSGMWTGTYKLTSCTGARHCGLQIGRTNGFSLRLEQTGSHVRGLFTLFEQVADVGGDVLPDGSLTLSGVAPQPTAKDSGLRVGSIALRFSPERALQGQLAYEVLPTQTQLDFEGAMVAGGEITSARRDDLRAFVASVDGTWSGRFVIRGCAPPAGAPYCNPYDVEDTVRFELSLSRSGAALTAAFTSGPYRIPLSGRIDGTVITLSGESDYSSSGGPAHLRVIDLHASIDPLGRLTGTFRFDYGWPSGAPTFGESATAELWQVVRIP